jgi:hypothetical protein
MAAELDVRKLWDLDLREVSAICERPVGHGRTRQLLAVGDQTHQILIGDLRAGGPGRFERRELAPLLAGAGLRTPQSSQWEGIDTDSTGRVFVLREVPGTVLVFDEGLQTLLHVFPLTVEDDPAEVEAWEADQNALGEGVLLLRNGHLFVLKEDKPASSWSSAWRARGPRASATTCRSHTPASSRHRRSSAPPSGC